MMTTPSPEQTRAVLVLGRSDLAEALCAALGVDCEFAMVSTHAEALAALREREFDAIIGAPELLQPSSPVGSREDAEAILEMIGHGVCTIDHGGNVHWSNQRFQALTPRTAETIRQAATEMCRELVAESPTPNRPLQRHRSLQIEDSYYDLLASAVFDARQHVERAVLVALDVTHTRRLQEKLNAIDAAGRELVRIDAEALAEMDVSERLELLEEKIIRCSRELLHFDHFNVRVLNKKNNQLDLLLAEGMTDAAANRQLYASTEGNGVTGYVAATGRSYICPDVERDPRVLAGLPDSRSTLTVALWLEDQVIGTLNVESDRVAAFTEDDRQFAEIFGRYIAIALNMLRLLAVERHATTDQVTADVLAELSAPLNDIVSETSTLMEEYIGHDDLRQRLHAVLDSVEEMKKRIRAMHEPRSIAGIADESAEADPLLVNKRILIADDEDVIRETIADVLTRAGALAFTAADGEQAVALVRAQQFDLIISDIKMPIRNGYEVFAAAREEDENARVLLITGFGYDPDHSIVRASREGLAGVLFKPFKVDVLLEEARKALSGKSKN